MAQQGHLLGGFREIESLTNSLFLFAICKRFPTCKACENPASLGVYILKKDGGMGVAQQCKYCFGLLDLNEDGEFCGSCSDGPFHEGCLEGHETEECEGGSDGGQDDG
jgi:hypothetical protein